jgi:hypothetical protein
MGYTTEFTGTFKLDKPLTAEQIEYLNMFSGSRRMNRDASKIKSLKGRAKTMFGGDCGDALNSRCLTLLTNLDLPIGPNGDFYCGTGDFGQSNDDSVLDYNRPPASQPGLWCQWVPTEDGTGIMWNGMEKFYNYVEWLQYLINNFLAPWELKLNGEVEWQGEDSGDFGKIVVKDNVVTTKNGKVAYK